MAAVLLIKCRGQYEKDGEIIPPLSAEQNQLFKYLSQFSMTPADRNNISIPKKKESNAWDEL